MRTPAVCLLVLVGVCGCEPRAKVNDVRRVALLGVSTQGVDFALLDDDGADLGLPLTGAVVTMNDVTFPIDGRVCTSNLGMLTCTPATSSVVRTGLNGLPEGLAFRIEDDTGSIAATWATPSMPGDPVFVQAPDIAPAGAIAVVVDSPLPFFVEELAGTWCTSPGGVCAAAATTLRVDAANNLMVRVAAPRSVGDHVASFAGASRYSDPVRCEGDVVCDRFVDADVDITVAVTVEQ